MKREIPQMFDIEVFSDMIVIFSAFHTNEVIKKGPYYFYEFLRKLRYRNVSLAIYNDGRSSV